MAGCQSMRFCQINPPTSVGYSRSCRTRRLEIKTPVDESVTPSAEFDAAKYQSALELRVPVPCSLTIIETKEREGKTKRRNNVFSSEPQIACLPFLTSLSDARPSEATNASASATLTPSERKSRRLYLPRAESSPCVSMASLGMTRWHGMTSHTHTHRRRSWALLLSVLRTKGASSSSCSLSLFPLFPARLKPPFHTVGDERQTPPTYTSVSRLSWRLCKKPTNFLPVPAVRYETCETTTPSVCYRKRLIASRLCSALVRRESVPRRTS